MEISEDNEQRAAAILHQVQHDLGATVFFEKPLTASDASGSGRVVIPKAIAEQYFPRLEQPSGLPVRAVDTRGHEYTFKFRFWINNQSRMYLLEGAGELHRQFTMVVGDVMVFAQKPDRTLVVAGRPATKNDVIRKAPVKRPAGEPKEKAKGGREPRIKQARHAGGTPAPHRKKAKPSTAQEPQRAALGDVPSLELDPAVDGIFRAVPDSAASTDPSGVAPGLRGRWVVTLNLAGELYQALFDSPEDAQEAFNAAGGQDGKGPLVGLSLQQSALQGMTQPQPQLAEQKEGLLGVTGAAGPGQDIAGTTDSAATATQQGMLGGGTGLEHAAHGVQVPPGQGLQPPMNDSVGLQPPATLPPADAGGAGVAAEASGAGAPPPAALQQPALPQPGAPTAALESLAAAVPQPAAPEPAAQPPALQPAAPGVLDQQGNGIPNGGRDTAMGGMEAGSAAGAAGAGAQDGGPSSEPAAVQAPGAGQGWGGDVQGAAVAGGAAGSVLL